MTDEQSTPDLQTWLANATLGETRETFALEGREELRDASLALLERARRRVLIFSYQLEAWCYNRPEVEEAIRQLAVRTLNPSCFILLQDNSSVLEEGHRLLHLSRRLTSKIQIQRPQRQDHLDHYQNFILVDDHGVLLQPIRTRPKASVSFYNPVLVRQLAAFFQDVWSESEPDGQLRELHI